MRNNNLPRFEGFLTATYLDNGEIAADITNAIHFGNMSNAAARSLAGDSTANIRYMAFGNGGTIQGNAGSITYKPPNVSNIVDSAASLYGEIYHKELSGTEDNFVRTVPSTTSYTDIKIVCTLFAADMGTLQPVSDNVDGFTVFDEMALYIGIPNISNASTLASSVSALMVTHVTFHPIQKALNRGLRIDYTVRVHLQ